MGTMSILCDPTLNNLNAHPNLKFNLSIVSMLRHVYHVKDDQSGYHWTYDVALVHTK